MLKNKENISFSLFVNRNDVSKEKEKKKETVIKFSTQQYDISIGIE